MKSIKNTSQCFSRYLSFTTTHFDMYIKKNFSALNLLKFTGGHLIWLTLWSAGIAALYHFTDWEWFTIPWLPLSLIGTAVAFYVGFKNNSAYDRLWEARKIWGGIVNNSRSFGTAVKAFLSDQFADSGMDNAEIQSWKKKLIYRQIGWLYALRAQLLIPTEWEHYNQGKHVGELAKRRMKRLGTNIFNNTNFYSELEPFINKAELDALIQHKNTATQIIDRQSQDFASLRKKGIIDDFRHIALQDLLTEFYTLQGKAERIKKFPLPRQYASGSFFFVVIFIFLLPLGMVSEFDKLGEFGIWLSIPFTVLVGWVYVMMELIGDYSENPFEGLANDIPMLSLCRTIEIDLREMLGEEDLPPPIQSKHGILN